MRTFSLFKIFFFIVVGIFFLNACQSKKMPSPPQYDLSAPSSVTIPSELKNISGITFFKGNASMIYAIDENQGSVYCYYPSLHNVVKSSFDMTGPFEDLAIMDSSIYVLKNTGTIYSFPMKSMGKAKLDTFWTYADFFPKGTYEAMYYADSSRKLVVINKTKSSDSRLTRCYTFNIDEQGVPHKSNSFVIYWSTIEKKLKKERIKGFHPTAIAQNPKTKEWYIISDNEKILFVLDNNWHPSRAYPLDSTVFSKPQGMAFDNNGDLYIANDGTAKSAPNLKVFPYINRSASSVSQEENED
ncbi:MAG: hypothetical protein DI598_01930 [Pseudopedobacter saltans]|uniref:NHL repeat containing protein n=1 Tax=Pseudopedobacter saltans TaxID=151895 RepID=A0A2W5H975_9SPHI|nr:MAG: hypothetical protein DI598_01930 [Pseudopedobacter saltans]